MSPVLLGIYLGLELLGHMARGFNFLRNCRIVFPQQLYHFTFLPEMEKRCNFSASFAKFVAAVFIIILNNNHPSEYKEVCPCGFDLHLPTVLFYVIYIPHSHQTFSTQGR
jgi:hypothetical protein